MKLFAVVIALMLCTLGCASNKLDVWHDVGSTAQEAEVGKIGEQRVTLRPMVAEKKNDAPRAALFVGDKQASRTPVYPGKTYHFFIEENDCFINGFTDRNAGRDDVVNTVKSKVPARSFTTVGHRGVHKHAPENTRISYVQAVEAKCPIVEFDTALSKDGQIVGMHDKTLERTTNGVGKVADMTVEQLRKLDAGSWKDPKYKGEPVPTIDDVAQVCRGKAILMLDLKSTGQGKAIAQWLEQSKFPRDQVILAPWDDAEGVELRKYITDVPMIRLTSKVPTETIDDAYFAGMKKMGFGGFSVNWQYLNKTFIDAAQRNGMKVYTWTLNDPSDIAGAVLNGVDGVITDDPATTMKLISDLVGR